MSIEYCWNFRMLAPIVSRLLQRGYNFLSLEYDHEQQFYRYSKN